MNNAELMYAYEFDRGLTENFCSRLNIKKGLHTTTTHRGAFLRGGVTKKMGKFRKNSPSDNLVMFEFQKSLKTLTPSPPST